MFTAEEKLTTGETLVDRRTVMMMMMMMFIMMVMTEKEKKKTLPVKSLRRFTTVRFPHHIISVYFSTHSFIAI